MSAVSPRDIRSALPEGGRLPRVGKLRLGIKKESTKNGSLVSYPSAVDYFVVNEDMATSKQAAESFHQVYGPEPREIAVTLPAQDVADILEGAYRSYGTGGLLKRRCSGPGGTCVTRGPDGGWISSPCKCETEGLDPADKKRHCQERFTLTIMLMDVQGVGVWQVDTGSRMAAEGLNSALRMIQSFRGHLQGAHAKLRVVPRQVAPGGVAKTVYILELGSADLTPAQALELGGGASEPQRVQLPPSTLDEGPDDLLDAEAVEWEAPGPRPDDDKHPEQIAHEQKLKAPNPPVNVVNVGDQIKALSAMERAELYRTAGIPKGSPAKEVRAKLHAAWVGLALPPYNGELEVRTLLQALLDVERQAAKDPVARESFSNFVDTGVDVKPGDQTTLQETP